MPLLPGYLRDQSFCLGLVSGNPSNSLLPEGYINAYRLLERRRELLIVVPRAEAEHEQGILGICFYLRSQHSRGGAPGLSPIATGFENQHLSPGER